MDSSKTKKPRGLVSGYIDLIERQDPEGVVLSSIDDLVFWTSWSTTDRPDADEGWDRTDL